MAKFFDNVLEFIGLEKESNDYEEEQQDTVQNEYSYDTQPKSGSQPQPRIEQSRASAHKRGFGRSNPNKVVSMYKEEAPSSNIIIFKPSSCDDAAHIIDSIKNNRPVITNFENIDEGTAQRVFDMVGGAVYCLGGTVSTISRMIYVFAPQNMDVIGDGKGVGRAGVNNWFMDLSK